MWVERACVRLRELAASHGELAKRLDELEQKIQRSLVKRDLYGISRYLSAGEVGIHCDGIITFLQGMTV